MHKKIVTATSLCLAFFLAIALSVLPVRAQGESLYTGENGEVVVCDDANLLTPEEEDDLFEIMKPLTQYGNVIFYTLDDNPYYDTNKASRAFYTSCFDAYDDGVIFTINMDDRELWISGYGDCQYSVTDSYCYTITDNIYTYATDQEYYECAAMAFEQIYAVMQGKDIPQPMRYTCNFLLAIAIALIINFLIVTACSRKRKPSLNTTKDNMIYHCDIHNAHAIFTHERRVYNPPSSNSGGSSGGGGGGGASSSGGGHSF